MTGKLTIRRNFGSHMVVTRVFWWDAGRREAGVELVESRPDGYQTAGTEGVGTLEVIDAAGGIGTEDQLAAELRRRAATVYNAD